MTPRAVIFDLDGTLLDTLADLADAANGALAAHGYPGHPVSAYRRFVGDGSAMLMTRALPPEHRAANTVQACLDRFIADYHLHWNRKTTPYPGIMELLAALQERQIKLAVVTNKPHRFTGQMMAHYFPGVAFDPVFGQRRSTPIKPDPTQALEAAKRMRVAPEECWFVGDSAVDMETARRAGMPAVGAAWGFRPESELREAGAHRIIDHPMALLAAFSDSV